MGAPADGGACLSPLSPCGRGVGGEGEALARAAPSPPNPSPSRGEGRKRSPSPPKGRGERLTKWWNGRHTVLRRPRPSGRGSSTLPLVTACRQGRCLAGSHKAGLPGSVPGPAITSQKSEVRGQKLEVRS